MTERKVPFKVKSIFEYKSDYDDDLSFPVGKIITVDEIEDDDWYSGTLDGKSGMFPKNFVEPFEEPILESEGVDTEDEPVVEDGEDSDDSEQVEEDVVPEPVPETVTTMKDELTKKETGEEEKEEEDATSATKVSPSKTMAKGSQPIFPQSTTRDDPYAIKKDFIASPKSSYIPQVKPRDNSFLIGGGRNVASESTTNSSEIYREHMDEDKEDQKVEEKLSLKERIALLQKRQQEEAEREAAAVKRQEERKKKLAEEKKKRSEQKEKEKLEMATDDDIQSIETNITGSSKNINTNITGESFDTMNSADKEKVMSPTESASQPIKEEEDEDESVEDDIKDDNKKDYEDQDEEQDNSDGENPPDDDEELRRRKLVQRMAKISGGRNMFGMMGMSPFGQIPSKTKAEAPTKTEEEDAKPRSAPEETEENEEKEEEDRNEEEMKPVPMLPFADPKALEKLKRSPTKESVEQPKEENVEVPKREDPALGEDDEPEEELNESQSQIQPDIPSVSKKAAIQTDSGIESSDAVVNDDGFEDIGTSRMISVDSADSTPTTVPVTSSVPEVPDSPEIPPTPVPTRAVPPTPPTPSAPEIPSRPPVPTRTNDETSSTNVVEADEETSSDDDSFSFSQPDPVATIPPPVPGQAPLPPVPEKTSETPTIPQENVPVPPTPTRIPAPPVPMTQAPPVPSHPSAPPPTTAPPTTAPPTTAPPTTAPPTTAPPTTAPPTTAPPGGMQRATTDVTSTGLAHNHTGSSMGSAGQLRRSSTDILKSKKDQTQADANLIQLEEEISSEVSSKNWWVKDLLPDYLTSKIGSELIYEVDTNTISKRGNRNKVYKDYYILFYDLSSIVFELEYDLEDPRSTIKFTSIESKPIPILRKDLLDKSYKEYGSNIIPKLGTVKSINGSVVNTIFDVLDKKVLPPIGSKSFGVPIYKNSNNHSITKVEEPKPGDILCIKNGKFHSGFKNISIGEEEIFVSVIYEHDLKKDKFKVYQAVGGQLKKESFRMDEMKKGQVRVFRIVARDYVDW